MSDPVTCYICDPENPDAAEEGCDNCNRLWNEYVAQLQEAGLL